MKYGPALAFVWLAGGCAGAPGAVDAGSIRDAGTDRAADEGHGPAGTAGAFRLDIEVVGGLYAGRGVDVSVFAQPGRMLVGHAHVDHLLPGGDALVEVGKVLDTGRAYDIDYYFDLNDNGHCDDADPRGRQHLEGVGADIVLRHPPPDGQLLPYNCPSK